MGLELDGLMCNKDEDRQEDVSKGAFFRTLRCNRNDQKRLYPHLPVVFFIALFKRNNSSRMSQELGMTHPMMFEALLCTGA